MLFSFKTVQSVTRTSLPYFRKRFCKRERAVCRVATLNATCAPLRMSDALSLTCQKENGSRANTKRFERKLALRSTLFAFETVLKMFYPFAGFTKSAVFDLD